MTSYSRQPEMHAAPPRHTAGRNDTVREVRIRRASLNDANELRALHRASLTELGRVHYSRGQVEGFLRDFDTVDEAILTDGTFLVADADGKIAASAAWTLRRPAYEAGLPPAHSDAGSVPAIIRAVFTHPDWGRRGLATRLMSLCEEEAVIHGGATHLELGATLPAVAFYRGRGYRPGRTFELALSNGERFAAINMAKRIMDPVEEVAA